MLKRTGLKVNRLLILLVIVAGCVAATAAVLRPPAVPLVACDPYFSIWSPANNLPDSGTAHWTGKPHRLCALLRIDGKPYRVMGQEPSAVPALEQKSLEVLPTRTIYEFQGGGVALTLTFMTPALPHDIDILSRPVTYVTFDLKSLDENARKVQVYFDASADIAVNTPNQRVEVETVRGSLRTARAGSVDQRILGAKGDDIRIDWGYLYLSAKPAYATVAAGARDSLLESFLAGEKIRNGTRQGTGETHGIALVFAELNIGRTAQSPWLMLAYDDLYSIQYMKQNLRPYWRRKGWDADDLLKASAKEYESLQKRCADFDHELMEDLRRAGGEKYAQISALAYRHCFAAGKFVADANGQPLQFSKENHSNGCIGTSDVFYPMSPQFLLFGPSVAKSFLVPFMNYAASEQWKFPFAPHDIGTYPMANGQVYGGGERSEVNQMPVEESGNLLILMAAVAQMEGHAGFASLYWPQLEQWAAYLKAKGYDPENQLCTDDFAGHLAHNVNLSAKAICALGSFAKLCQMRGDEARANEYFTLAREFAQRWVAEANDGEKYRLAFNRPGTWSQKYNLVWDRILGLKLFPEEVLRKEMAFYLQTQNAYGLPLDNRKDYTKLDWILWTATLTRDRSDFEALVEPVYRYINETENRAPMSDWYNTRSARKVGFTARPVVGGVFLEMLYDREIWTKYARRDLTKAAKWAPIPKLPKIVTVLPAGDAAPFLWQYTTNQPASDWYQPQFDASGWLQGGSGFGTPGTPGSFVNTPWNTRQIWLRREVDLTRQQIRDVQAWIHHDEDAEVYINGVLALRAQGFSGSYDAMPLTSAGKKALKPGKNVIAIHCRQTTGGQYIDFGLARKER